MHIYIYKNTIKINSATVTKYHVYLQWQPSTPIWKVFSWRDPATHYYTLQNTATHYRLAKNHRMPHLYRSFSAKEPYN